MLRKNSFNVLEHIKQESQSINWLNYLNVFQIKLSIIYTIPCLNMCILPSLHSIYCFALVRIQIEKQIKWFNCLFCLSLKGKKIVSEVGDFCFRKPFQKRKLMFY